MALFLMQSEGCTAPDKIVEISYNREHNVFILAGSAYAANIYIILQLCCVAGVLSRYFEAIIPF